MPLSIGKLEKLTGHAFKDIKLLERAVTHRSWAFENTPGATDEDIRDIENESMEFLGDSVLGLVVAEHLYVTHPELAEGDLTLMKHHLVSTVTLARIADTLELGEFLKVGRGEEKTGGRKKQALLANTLEAVIGAVFLDGGYTAARLMIKRLLGDELRAATPERSLDYKTLLQETLQARRMSAPSYTVVRTDGPPHERTFAVEAVWATGRAEGEGNSIKAAEMMAAERALGTLKRAQSGDAKR
jgi:ribonuclease III